MDIYERSYKILSMDVDMDRRLRPSVLFSMLQEASIAHTEELGVGREKTLDRGLLWIISLQAVEIDRMPEYDEEIVLRSWPGESLHLIFPRYFSIETAQGEPLLKASSLWTLIDQNTRKLIFPEKYGVFIEGERTGSEIALPSAPRPIPCTGSRRFQVPYSYIDINGHMNNARYLDLALDCIHDKVSGMELRSIRAEYSHEVRLGETLELSWGEDSGRFFISGSTDKPCFRLGLQYA